MYIFENNSNQQKINFTSIISSFYANENVGCLIDREHLCEKILNTKLRPCVFDNRNKHINEFEQLLLSLTDFSIFDNNKLCVDLELLSGFTEKHNIVNKIVDILIFIHLEYKLKKFSSKKNPRTILSIDCKELFLKEVKKILPNNKKLYARNIEPAVKTFAAKRNFISKTGEVLIWYKNNVITFKKIK